MIRIRLAAAAAALLVTGAVLSVAGPAFADPTTTSTSTTSTTLDPCTPASSAPLYTARCVPNVDNSNGTVTVTLPGVGTLTFLVNPDGTVNTSTAPSVSVIGANFSGGTPTVSADGTHISVSFVNIAAPHQHYTIKVKLSPPTSQGGPVGINATAGPNKHKGHHGDHEGDHDGNKGNDNDPDDQGQGNHVAPAAIHMGQAPWSGQGHGGGGD
jgi:hypothetical protein